MTDRTAELNAMRAKLFEDARDLYLHIGYFITWFTTVETHLTFQLAITLDYSQLGDFELLVKGMDARVKCERLRKACKNRRPMGTNFAKRLLFFEKRMIPLRNKLTHSLVAMPDRSGAFYFTSLSRIPSAALGLDHVGEPPESMTGHQLFEHGFWLNCFAADLAEVLRTGFRGKTLEIDHPRSRLPTACH